MANLVIDIQNTCLVEDSLLAAAIQPSSGVLIGRPVDLLQANTLCNVRLTYGTFQSGFVGYQVQESDTTTSGSFVPVQSVSGTWNWLSGSRIVINSSGIGQSGTGVVSGDTVFAAFERRFRYVRVIQESGGLADTFGGAGVVSQLKVTGSGGGFSFSPGSGVVNV